MLSKQDILLPKQWVQIVEVIKKQISLISNNSDSYRGRSIRIMLKDPVKNWKESYDL